MTSTSAPLRDIVDSLIGAETLSTQRLILLAHPELLSTAVQESLGKRLRESVPPASLVLRERIALIKRCEEIGIPAAFAELVASRSDAQAQRYLDDTIAEFIECNGFDAKREYVGSHPELLSDEVMRKLAPREALSGNEQRQYALAGYFLTLCHELGVSRMTAETRDIHLALEGLCGCVPGPDQAAFIQKHPVLLLPDVDYIAAAFEAANVAPAHRQSFSQLRALLVRSRSVGVPAAFEDDFEQRRRRLIQRTSKSMLDLASTATMQELREHIENYPELLGVCSHPEVGLSSEPNPSLIAYIDLWLEKLASGNEISPRGRELMRRNATILQRVRQVGVANAFEEYQNDASRALPFESATALLSRTAVEILGSRLSLPEGVSRVQDASDVLRVVRESGFGDVARVCLSHIRDPQEHLTVAELLDATVALANLSVQERADRKTHLCGYLAEVARSNPQAHPLQHRALALGREAVALLADASLPPPDSLCSNIAAILFEAFKRQGDPSVLHEAVETMREAARRFPDEVHVLGNLGAALAMRYGCSGSFSDIDEAVTVLRQAARNTNVESAQRFGALIALGSALRKRAPVHDLSDLVEAEKICGELIAMPSLTSANRGIALNNLALVQRDRYQQSADPALIDAAAKSMSQAIDLSAPHGWEWVNRTVNLADIMHTRHDASDLPADLEASIGLARSALAIAPRHSAAIETLARALLSRFDLYDTRDDLDTAIQLLESAEAGREALGDYEIARSYQHALHRRYQLDQTAEDLERALQISLLLIEKSPAGSVLWAIQHADTAHLLELQYIATGSPSYRDRSIDARRKALSVFSATRTPSYYARAAGGLIRLLRDIPDWPAAYEAGKAALEALHELRRLQGTGVFEAQARKDVDLVLLCRYLTEACLKAEDSPARKREAMVYAETGKARVFLDQMSTVDLLAPAGVPEDLLFRERDIRLQLRRLVSSSASVPDAAADEHRESLQGRLEDILQQIERYPGAQPYVAARRGTTPSWEDLAELAALLGERAAVVEFAILQSEEIVAFVLRAGWDAPEVITLPIRAMTLANRYMRSFFQELHGPMHASLHRSEWLGLGSLLIEPLESKLEDVELVCFIPHLILRYLPLHALTVGGEPFITRRAVCYAPSAGVLLRILRGERTRAMQGAQSLVMSYTDGGPAEKEVFEYEARVVADVLGAVCVNGDLATESVLREHARTASIIHLSCHGQFDPSDPLASAVKLHGGLFTARDWMRLQVRSDLVVLSACETGMNDVGLGDDITGLTSALLYSGAASVLLTLWRVNAVSTLEWMVKFYETLQALSSSSEVRSFAIARAFQVATLHVRERHPEVHHWGAFILQGDCQ